MQVFMSGLLISCFALQAIAQQSPEYYWREYLIGEEAPDDAVIAGTDSEGVAIYIGQVFRYEHGLCVTPIVLDEEKVKCNCDGAFEADRDVKILCAENPDKYEWYSSSTYGVPYLEKEGRELVIGGFDGTQKQYVYYHVGRTEIYGSKIIGLIDGNNTLQFLDDNGEPRETSYFDILLA